VTAKLPVSGAVGREQHVSHQKQRQQHSQEGQPMAAGPVPAAPAANAAMAMDAAQPCSRQSSKLVAGCGAACRGLGAGLLWPVRKCCWCCCMTLEAVAQAS
jgi:hypothetical protein